MKNEGNTGVNKSGKDLEQVVSTRKKPYVCFFSLEFLAKNRFINCHLLTAQSEQITELFFFASVSLAT